MIPGAPLLELGPEDRFKKENRGQNRQARKSTKPVAQWFEEFAVHGLVVMSGEWPTRQPTGLAGGVSSP